jgi:hypothetical protein
MQLLKLLKCVNNWSMPLPPPLQASTRRNTPPWAMDQNSLCLSQKTGRQVPFKNKIRKRIQK